jgi:hypothetical protein
MMGAPYNPSLGGRTRKDYTFPEALQIFTKLEPIPRL